MPDTTNLPPEFAPNPELTPAPAVVPDQFVDMGSKHELIARSLGAVAVPIQAVSKLRALGIEVETAGIVRVADGLALLTHQSISHAMTMMAADIKDGQTAKEFTPAIASLSRASALIIKAMKTKYVDMKVTVREKGVERPSFAIGGRIGDVQERTITVEK